MAHSPEKIRSFTLLGGSGVGKTSLAEALLFAAGVTHRLGKVDEGNSVLDQEPEELKRKISLSSKVQCLDWQGYRLHFADTPGFPDFSGEAVGPLAMLDAAVIVVDATVGVDVAAQQFFRLAVRHKKPILFFVNKMDKEHADFEKTLASIRALSKHAQPVGLPIGAGAEFRGVLDLVDGRAFRYEKGQAVEVPVPFEEAERFQAAQRALIEEIAETDEALFERLAGGEALKKDDVLPRLIQDIEDEEILPVLVGSALPPQGITLLLDTLTHLVLSPDRLPDRTGVHPQSGEPELRKPFVAESAAAQVFKVISDPGIGDIFFMKIFSGTLRHGEDLRNGRSLATERLGHLFLFQGKERKEVGEATVGEVVGVAKLKNTRLGDTLGDPTRPIQLPAIAFPEPVLSVAIHPKTRQDQEKLGIALGKLTSNDPTFHFHIDPESGETLVSGMGEVHIEVITERLRGKYGIEITLGKPHVPYRETVMRKVKVQGKYKKQSGGHGQYGDVWIEIEPLPPGAGFEFVDAIKGGVIPSKYIPAVEEGIKQAMRRGVLAGYPVVDLKATLCDGTYHSVDSSDLAFQIAGSMAFKKAEEEARPILLEPIMNLEVSTPAEFVGAISNDLSSRRGRIVGMEQDGDMHLVRGEAPMAELFKYATDLRSLTHGAGSYRTEFARYEPLPPPLFDKVEKRKPEGGH
ncbi:MAG: elongation factor G [bacterium]